MTSTSRARHRTDGAARTPLTGALSVVTDTLSVVASPVGARSAGVALALSSGLVGTIAAPAGAQPVAPETTVAAEAQTDDPTTSANDGTLPWPESPDTADASASADPEAEEAAPTPTSTPTTTPAAVPAPRAPQQAAPPTATTPAAQPATTAPKKATAPAKATRGSRVITVAMRYVGVPYLWGGTSPRGFDCSGYTQYVYGRAGHHLPRTVAQQRDAVKRIPRSKARPGDLVFFGDYHVAIYVGGNRMIAAPRRGKTVQVQSIYSANVTFGRA